MNLKRLLFLILILIIFMAEPLWGELAKSLDSNETIEQAITRIVSEHNDDTEAHLGAGQSLNSHKTETIIDHPAHSIVMDKIPFLQYEEYIGDISSAFTDTEFGTVNFSNFFISGRTGFDGDFFGWRAMNFPTGSSYGNGDLIIQFTLNIQGSTSSARTCGISLSNGEIEEPDRIEIRQDTGAIYFRIYESDILVYEVQIGAGPNYNELVRIWWDSVHGKIILYRGTTQAGEYTPTDLKLFIFERLIIFGLADSPTDLIVNLSNWRSTYILPE
jgi:hypothetical protein